MRYGDEVLFSIGVAVYWDLILEEICRVRNKEFHGWGLLSVGQTLPKDKTEL